MSFLDNAGTIILDAVLTDIGRKRMAQGSFKVAKFALGDDEVNYELFDLDGTVAKHETNSDDRRIISQSCFEAYGEEHAAITYGLTSQNRADLLYLPILKINEKVTGSLKKGTSDFYYLSTNEETTTKLTAVFGNYDYFLQNNSVSTTKIVVESGIDSVDSAGSPYLLRTDESRDAFIMQTGLFDNYFNVYCDNRFYDGVYGAPDQSVFSNDLQGKHLVNFELLTYSPPTSFTQVLDKHTAYIVNGVHNLVYSPSQMNGSGLSDLDISAIGGPRGAVTAVNLKVIHELNPPSGSAGDTKYTIFGKTDQTLFGGSDKYDYIDSPIYIEGVTSGARIQIPIRIIRYVGT